MKILITIFSFAFLVQPYIAFGSCSITTPNFTANYSAIVPNPYLYNLNPYTITFQCQSGLPYVLSYVGPTQNTGGMIQHKYVETPTKYFQLYLYRDAGRTDAIRPSQPNIKTGIGTGAPDTAIIYPQTRVGSGATSGCILKVPHYFCPPGTLNVNIVLKIVF